MDADTFWGMVNMREPEECWLWRGIRSGERKGYGVLRIDGVLYKAHRAAIYFHTGMWPGPDDVVLHLCDTPLCCNPAHLKVGTTKDNMQDMLQKGRANRPAGERHWNSRLDARCVVAIRRLKALDRLTNVEIAAAFGVTASTVAAIVHGRSYKKVD